MALNEQLLCTPIPNGIDTSGRGSFKLSVLISPTLSGGSALTLNDFPDFQQWPRLITDDELSFDVTISNGAKTAMVTKNTGVIDTSVLNNALWTELFSPASSVMVTPRDPGEPFTDLPIVSYPVTQIHDFIRDAYTKLVQESPTAIPSLDLLSRGGYDALGYATPDDVRGLDDLFAALSQARLSGGSKANDFLSSPSAKNAFAALRFYHMAGAGTQPVASISDLTTEVDFHSALSFIGEHPALQRALGLVFDVEVADVAIPEITSTLSSDIYVSVVPAIGNPASRFTPSAGVTYTPVSPRVQCDASTTVFTAHAVSPQLVGGQLTLGDTTSFTVYDLDVDGGGLKNANFADNLKLAQTPQVGSPAQSSDAGPAPDAPTAAAPPSLRSTGIAVAAINRGVTFAQQLTRGGDLLSSLPGPVPDLTAEDLVRGFVLDVWDGSNWRSTASRAVHYVVTGGQSLIAFFEDASTDAPPRFQTDPTNASQNQFNLSENLIRWNGWSNAAPRPGSAIQADGTTITPAAAAGPFGQLAITILPFPKSLPRLRYGTAYALRARAVDLAGNVVKLANAAQIGDALQRISPIVPFSRYEPIGSPDVHRWPNGLLQQTDPSTGQSLPGIRPGESLKRLVIRDIDAAAGSVRALAPKSVGESFAELHGVFDANGEFDPNQTAYGLIKGAEGQYGRYDVIDPAQPVPYLPDPLAMGAALTVTAGPLQGTTLNVGFNAAAYPAYQPYLVRLQRGVSAAAALDAANRAAVFTLGEADVIEVQVSSTGPTAADLPKFGIVQWLMQAGQGTLDPNLQQQALNGQLWAMSPSETLELVYAVRQPLQDPSYINLEAQRGIGDTLAKVLGDFTYDPASTSKTEVLGEWLEPVDNGPGSGHPQGPGSDTNQTLHDVMTNAATIPDTVLGSTRVTISHEFFDTKHRNVSYTVRATSTFTEHYRGNDTTTASASPLALHLPNTPVLGLEPHSVTITSPDGTTAYTDGVDFTVDPNAGTVTFVPGGGLPAGTPIAIAFLPLVSRPNVVPSPAPDTAVALPPAAPPVPPGVNVNVWSSARPHTPEVADVIPIYQWTGPTTTSGRTTSARMPSAIRIYLERPWWTSGVGELLGVLTDPSFPTAGTYEDTTPGASELAATRGHYVSDWGVDPVFKSAALPTPHPGPAAFPSAVAQGTGLALDETSVLTVNASGHNVLYDATRDQWYCDVTVDTGGAYTPMVRLAIARYQPDSIPGVELSRVVLIDVMAIEPGRYTVVVRKSLKLIASVTLTGYSYAATGRSPKSPLAHEAIATVVVERRVKSIPDDVIGWEPVGKGVEMKMKNGPAGMTEWVAKNISVPANGEHRLYIAQYEVIPMDQMTEEQNLNLVYKYQGLRLVHQDMIPL